MASQFVFLSSEQRRNYYVYEILRAFARLSEFNTTKGMMSLAVEVRPASTLTPLLEAPLADIYATTEEQFNGVYSGGDCSVALRFSALGGCKAELAC